MPFDYVEELLQNPNNRELDIIRRQPERSATGEKHPNTSNELPSNNSIPNQDITVNTYSMQESEKEFTKNNDKKYSIRYTTDNKPVAVIDDDILSGKPKSEWVKTVKDTI